MFQKIQRPLGLLVVAASLAACGGGGNSAPSFAELETRGGALYSELGQLSYTNPATLPDSGSATYNGVLGFGEVGAQIFGEMRLNANFGSSTINGNVSNFVDSDDSRYGGSLSIANGKIDQTTELIVGPTFEAAVSAKRVGSLFVLMRQ